MDNDYAPRILQKRREYAEVQRILKDRDIQFQTMYPARLKVKYDEGTKIYETVEEATQDMVKRDHPIEIIMAPETLMEQLRQLTWQKGSRRVVGRASSPRHIANYKEKLQTYKRDRPPASVVVDPVRNLTKRIGISLPANRLTKMKWTFWFGEFNC